MELALFTGPISSFYIFNFNPDAQTMEPFIAFLTLDPVSILRAIVQNIAQVSSCSPLLVFVTMVEVE